MYLHNVEVDVEVNLEEVFDEISDNELIEEFKNRDLYSEIDLEPNFDISSWNDDNYKELATEYFRGNFNLKKLIDIIGKNNIKEL